MDISPTLLISEILNLNLASVLLTSIAWAIALAPALLTYLKDKYKWVSPLNNPSNLASRWRPLLQQWIYHRHY